MIELPMRVELLQKTSIFRNLRNNELCHQLASVMHEVSFSSGHAIIRQGHCGDQLYMLVNGRAKVAVNSVHLTSLEPGSYFGEMALFGSTCYSATVTATSDCFCLTLDHETLKAAMHRAPRIALNIMQILCRRIRKLSQMMLVSQCPSRARAGSPLPPSADRRELLRTIPIFADLQDEKCLARMAATIKEVSFPAGTPIFTIGDKGDLLYVMLEGQVKVHMDDLELSRLGPGAHFGELSLLDAEPRSASVTAVHDSRCLVLNQQQLYAIFSQAPSVAMNLTRTLCERVRELSTELTEFVNAPNPAASEEPASATILAPSSSLYLELPAESFESLFVWDETTHSWRLPLTPSLAQEFVNTLTAAQPPSLTESEEVDGFQRALAAEKQALHTALIELDHSCRPAQASTPVHEKLARFVEDLYALLRTPLHPKKSYLALAHGLYHAARNVAQRVHLRAVLASPTAATEIQSFLRCADTFRQHEFNVDLKVLLVRWENLIEVRHQSPQERQSIFERQVRDVQEMVKGHACGAVDIVPVNVEADCETATIAQPRDFSAWSAKVLRAAADLNSGEPGLTKNLLWITGFYGRQTSLRRLGEKQALLDLAIRQAIGARCQAEYASGACQANQAFAMLTSELQRRLLTCYGVTVPMVNIEVHRN